LSTLSINNSIYPERISILQVGLRISLLSMDKVWEFRWVSDEEDGSVVENPIPVSFVGPKLDSKATRITSSVCRACLASHCGKSSGGFDLLADRLEKRVIGKVAHVMSDFEVSMGTSGFGVDLGTP
jgi:hypothetical protein